MTKEDVFCIFVFPDQRLVNNMPALFHQHFTAPPLCISASSLCRSFLNILMPSLSVLTYTAEYLEKPS